MKKKVVFDTEDIESIKKALNIVKTYLGNVKSGESKRASFRRKFADCMSIIDTDISRVYQSLSLDENPIYYVYTHCKPNSRIAVEKDFRTSCLATFGATKMPFYVGKGCGNRAYDLNRNGGHRKIRQLLNQYGQEICVEIIKDGLTELEALSLESKLIDIFGIAGKGGCLVNLDEGSFAKERRLMYENSFTSLAEVNKGMIVEKEISQMLK